jgi:putative hydrolase of the HAD superfamily
LAIDKIKTKPYDTIVVGDSYNNDIVPSKILGCKTIWVKNKTWNDSDDISSADFIINSIKELQEVLKNIN